ncbi:uncharacterized protein LOC128509738 [Clarias gariepinus]|uniref:uncharacterized protein LOC128509738 n=1 Tax=Clarias gariepinus TaxID=13013 RepID=UPI00234E24BF|nr:uncharacterized protein LOC128509738 [Clarias gariepinus]
MELLDVGHAALRHRPLKDATQGSGLLSDTLCSLTLEAEAGDKVTVWCQHNLTRTGYIYWFKHTSDSVPLLIGCKQFFTSAPSETCYFFTESERIVTAVHDKNTSLTITAVNVSDTGLYYCIYMEKNQIPFSDSVYLRVKGVNKTLTKITDRANGSDCPAVSFMLTAVFGAVIVIVILLSVLIFIILKHKGHEASKNKDPEADSEHFAALHLPKKKNKRANKCNKIVYTDVAS